MPQRLIKHHDMKEYVGVKVKLHTFLTMVLEGYEWLA